MLAITCLLNSCGGGGSESPAAVAAPAGGDAVGLAIVGRNGTVQTFVGAEQVQRGMVRALAESAPAADRVVMRGQSVRVIGYAYYNVFTCQIIDTGTLTPTVAPKYGQISTGTLAFTLGAAGACTGVSLPFLNAFYTWTTDPPPGVTTDSFSLRFSAVGGTVVADSSWTVYLLDLDAGGNQGYPGPDHPEPSCHAPTKPNSTPIPSTGATSSAPGCTEGNPIHFATGNKVQSERDVVAAAHAGVSFTRYYNSLDVTVTTLGPAWRSEWDRNIRVDPSNGQVIFVREDGQLLRFQSVTGSNELAPLRTDIVQQLRRLTDSAGAFTGWQLTRSDDSVETYATSGRLLSVRTRSGRTTTLSYDAANRLTSVVGPFGHAVGLAYTGANLTRVTGPDGAAYSFAYDAGGNLRSVTYPDSKTKSYVYENGAYPRALTGVIDELGSRYATYAYDASGRGISSEHAGGAGRVTLSYALDGTTSLTNSLNYTRVATQIPTFGIARPILFAGARFYRSSDSAYGYADSGFLASTTDWNGNVTTFTHDVRGNETSRTEASGTPIARTISAIWHSSLHLPIQIVEPTRSTSFTYDAAGNVLTRTVADGATSRTWSFTYSSVGQVLSAADPKGNVSRYSYDAQGNLASVTNALGHRTAYDSYDGAGRLLRTTDPNGLVTTFTYDARGRLTSRNVGGQLTSISYDAAGNVATVTSPDNSKLTMGYDAAHRLTSITDSLGNRIVYTLDGEGNRTSVGVYNAAGALNRTVSYAYDDANRVVKVTGAVGQTTVITRDGNGNPVSVTDPVGAITRSVYDALNRLSSTTDALGGVTTLGYDAMDRVTSVTDPRSLVTSYVYSGLGDLLRTVSPDSGTTSRAFDANGNLSASTDARGTTNTRAYDALNRLTSIAFSGNTLSYQYDTGTTAIGRLTRVSGNTDSTAFAYDLWGHLLSKQQSVGTANLTESRSYDAAGRLRSMTYPSGLRIAYGYDAAGQVNALTVNGAAFLSGITHEPFGPARSWSWAAQAYSRYHDTDGRLASFPLGGVTRTLSYDAASQIKRYSDSSGVTQSFGYDPLGRLTGFTSSSTSETYGYDPDGNRTSLTTSGLSSAYTVSAVSNQLASRTNPAASYVYDAAGNLTSSGSLSFSYDALGRMTASLNGSARSARTLYVTSGLGQRLQKSGTSGTINFLYGEGSQLHGEYGSASSQETIYLEGMPVGVFNNGTLLRLFADQLGAPRAIADAAGAQVWAWDGDPFGNVATTGSLTFNQRFPGQYADVETGLFFNHARYYDARAGRYTQSDPIGLAGGMNTYAYALAAPVGGADPMGLDLRMYFKRALGLVPFHVYVTIDTCGCQTESFEFAPVKNLLYPFSQAGSVFFPVLGQITPEAPGEEATEIPGQRVSLTAEQGQALADALRQLEGTLFRYSSSALYGADNCATFAMRVHD